MKGRNDFSWDANLKMIIAGPKEYDEKVVICCFSFNNLVILAYFHVSY